MRCAGWVWIGSLGLLVGCSQRIASEPTPTPSPTVSQTPTPGPTPDTGDGRDGDIVVDGDLVINTCTPVTSSSGSDIVVTNATGFDPGDMVLVVQTQDTFATSGPAATVSSAGRAGVSNLARVADINGTTVTLDAGLTAAYGSDATGTAQACLVPQYGDVTVESTGRLLAADWNGATGGIVAFYANGTVSITGQLDADAAGFRPGQPVGNDGSADITDETTVNNQGGGKGEGLDITSLTLAGRGAMGNAAGGGNAHNAGGGGGGNGGAGGFGGKQAAGQGDEPNTKGRGGGAVDLAGDIDLVFGGGGGAGHHNEGNAGEGGFGGGLILVVANVVEGAGTLTANGTDGEGSLNAASPDGAGGAGAGGTIVLRAVDGSGFTGLVQATGGAGGDNAGQEAHGTGGGGGGGRFYWTAVENATTDLSGGAAGLTPNDGTHEATPGGPGLVVELPEL